MAEKYIIGIDEVGRGALAGPVAVAAVLLPSGFGREIAKAGLPMRDSKKLSPKQRENWFRFIKNHPKIFYAVASVSPKIIDEINISQAANLAATRAFHRLIANRKAQSKHYKVFLDGGLYLQKIPYSKFHILNSIIKGDEKIPAISLASVVAKVTRDKKMKKLHEKYPRYDFMNNVGYGTEGHIKAIKKCGHSAVHRRSFRIHSFAEGKFSE
ncbi:MAG: ribonuclease HII [Parcubacteria group bacterium]|nr:ribonuclease HII [Parcubacteria group bacterium]